MNFHLHLKSFVLETINDIDLLVPERTNEN